MFLMQHFNKTATAGDPIKILFPPRADYRIALEKLHYRAGGTEHNANILECVAAGTRASAVTALSQITCTTLVSRYASNVEALYLVTCSSTYTNVTLHGEIIDNYNTSTKVISMTDQLSVDIDANSLYFLMRHPSAADDFSNARRNGGTIPLIANSTTLHEVSNALLIDSTRLGEPLMIYIENPTNAGKVIVCSGLYYQ